MATAKGGFWTNPNTEPKRAYRFYVDFGKLFGSIPDAGTYLAKKVTKPKFATTETVHTYLNHKFYYPTRVEWNEVVATIVDPAVPNITARLLEHQTGIGYKIPANSKNKSTISKSLSTEHAGSVRIYSMDSAGTTLEEWKLNNAWVKDFAFNELSYESDELVTVDITFRYDWATYKAGKQDAGVKGKEFFALS